MTAIKSMKAKKALLRKGFKEAKGDHYFLIYYHDGLKTDIRTKISRDHSELNEWLIAQMKKQICLSKTEFIGVVDCSISKEKLQQIYLKMGKIEKTTLNDL